MRPGNLLALLGALCLAACIGLPLGELAQPLAWLFGLGAIVAMIAGSSHVTPYLASVAVGLAVFATAWGGVSTGIREALGSPDAQRALGILLALVLGIGVVLFAAHFAAKHPPAPASPKPPRRERLADADPEPLRPLVMRRQEAHRNAEEDDLGVLGGRRGR